jgi:putative Mg2+ transporter-C (MgtC) family protein
MRLKPFVIFILFLCGVLACTSVEAHSQNQSWRFLAGGSLTDFFSVSEFEFVIRLFVALILGLICGYSHGAGSGSVTISIKTFAAVCLGAATFTSVMIHVNYLTHIPNILNGIGNVITGIGFVCAAVIFKKDNIVSGLSTAATLWTSAGVGMACGSAMYGIAVTVTFLLVMFHLFPLNKKHLMKQLES